MNIDDMSIEDIEIYLEKEREKRQEKIESKKNLGDKIIEPICIGSGRILDVDDVKKHIKLFIKSFKRNYPKSHIEEKAKEIFGKKLI